MKAIVLFTKDLRLADNPALFEACKRAKTVIPLYVHDTSGPWPAGSASRVWLSKSLAALQQEIPLTLRVGPTVKVLKEVIKETGATHLFYNREYEPGKREPLKVGIDVHTFNGFLLWEPWTICNQQMKPYQVFTPFYKACLASETPPKPLGRPLFPDIQQLKSDSLDLLPAVRWDRGFIGTPGEKGALAQLKTFQEDLYAADRDYPELDHTSRLSAHLHFGEISPRTIWHHSHAEPFKRQLVWREFANHLLYHFPHTTDSPLREEFASFPWRNSEKDLEAWKRGKTGFPLVDAGMRELWHTGWMHNRVRMVVGSFLVKDLLISWQEGAKWFWETLTDADLANNTLGWQWIGGCGADAAPYFRIFNPTTQAEKFDPQGAYIKKWAPEYMEPILDHKQARERALRAYASLKE